MVGSIYVAVVALAIFQPDDNLGTRWFKLCFGESSLSCWRVFAIASCLPAILGTLLVGLYVPESPRFLDCKQTQQGETPTAETQNEDNTFLDSQDSEEEGIPYIALVDTEEPQNEHNDEYDNIICCTGKYYLPPALQLITRLELRSITWPLLVVWFSLCFGSFGILTWINTLFVEIHLENMYINDLLFALANLPGNIASALLMDWTGRRNMLVSSALGGALSLLAFASLAHQLHDTGQSDNGLPKAIAGGIVISACVFQACITMAWNTIDTMTLEMFPIMVRSTGMGLCSAMGRVGAMVAQLVNGGALMGNPVLLLLVASTSLAVTAAAPFLLPSTPQQRNPSTCSLLQDDEVDVLVDRDIVEYSDSQDPHEDEILSSDSLLAEMQDQ